jgi:hypothetical protein
MDSVDDRPHPAHLRRRELRSLRHPHQRRGQPAARVGVVRCRLDGDRVGAELRGGRRQPEPRDRDRHDPGGARARGERAQPLPGRGVQHSDDRRWVGVTAEVVARPDPHRGRTQLDRHVGLRLRRRVAHAAGEGERVALLDDERLELGQRDRERAVGTRGRTRGGLARGRRRGRGARVQRQPCGGERHRDDRRDHDDHEGAGDAAQPDGGPPEFAAGAVGGSRTRCHAMSASNLGTWSTSRRSSSYASRSPSSPIGTQATSTTSMSSSDSSPPSATSR